MSETPEFKKKEIEKIEFEAQYLLDLMKELNVKRVTAVTGLTLSIKSFKNLLKMYKDCEAQFFNKLGYFKDQFTFTQKLQLIRKNFFDIRNCIVSMIENKARSVAMRIIQEMVVKKPQKNVESTFHIKRKQRVCAEKNFQLKRTKSNCDKVYLSICREYIFDLKFEKKKLDQIFKNFKFKPGQLHFQRNEQITSIHIGKMIQLSISCRVRITTLKFYSCLYIVNSNSFRGFDVSMFMYHIKKENEIFKNISKLETLFYGKECRIRTYEETVQFLKEFIKAVPYFEKEFNTLNKVMKIFPDSLKKKFNRINELIKPTIPKKFTCFKHCRCCDKKSTKKCSRCKNVYYCSRECQKKDWKFHKTECKEEKGEKKKLMKFKSKFGMFI